MDVIFLKNGFHYDVTLGATSEQLFKKAEQLRATFKRIWNSLWLRLLARSKNEGILVVCVIRIKLRRLYFGV